MIIKDIICVGTGFSAYLLKILSRKKIFFISSNYKIVKNLKNFQRRKNFENHVKFFTKKTNSYGILNLPLTKNITLHDTLIDGGNTNYWGGFINKNKIKKKNFFKIIKKEKIYLKKIFRNSSEYACSDKGIHQICDHKSKILNISGKFQHYIHGHATKIQIMNKNSLIKVFYILNNKSYTVYCRKLFLGVGVVQLLELFLNSNFLSEKDIFSLSEFKYNLKFSTNKNFIINSKSIVIKYPMGTAIKHFFGFKYNYFKFLNWINVYFDQIFFKKKQNFFFKIQKNNIVQINKLKNYFGKSIHYCNLRINSINANDFLIKFSKNLYGISAPFVNQGTPGPISNDIINNLYKVLKK
jgi:hypothetical protein